MPYDITTACAASLPIQSTRRAHATTAACTMGYGGLRYSAPPLRRSLPVRGYPQPVELGMVLSGSDEERACRAGVQAVRVRHSPLAGTHATTAPRRPRRMFACSAQFNSTRELFDHYVHVHGQVRDPRLRYRYPSVHKAWHVHCQWPACSENARWALGLQRPRLGSDLLTNIAPAKSGWKDSAAKASSAAWAAARSPSGAMLSAVPGLRSQQHTASSACTGSSCC